jgi:hypothetical protein
MGVFDPARHLPERGVSLIRPREGGGSSRPIRSAGSGQGQALAKRTPLRDAWLGPGLLHPR